MVGDLVKFGPSAGPSSIALLAVGVSTRIYVRGLPLQNAMRRDAREFAASRSQGRVSLVRHADCRCAC